MQDSYSGLSHFRTLTLLVGSFAVGTAAYAQAPAILTGGTVNSADYSRSFAPGAIVSVFGTNLASSIALAGAFPLPQSLGGASIELVSNGEQFSLWYASPTQLNGQMPYDVPTGPVQVRVRTAAGVSNIDTITVAARAPKIFTIDFTGQGQAVATTPAYQILSANVPAKPADTIVLWMNSMGASSGNPVAGQPAPGTTTGSLPSTIAGVTVSIDGVNAPVTFAGLSPGSAGLYQVNIQAPFVVITGLVSVQVTVDGVSTQGLVTIPFRQLGFYSSLLGGKAVAGQTLNGVSGATSALAFRQSDPLTWGSVGLNAWTDNTGLGSQYSIATGVAMTLRNGTSIVYDNNGIETGTMGTFYNNTNGPADSQKPGLSDLYSMSNYFPLTFAGYFKLAQSTTITELIGYFDTLDNLNLPFDPLNEYVLYRVNIFSNATGTVPKETGNFTGDVLSSDTAKGTFSFSDTGVKILSSIPNDIPKPLYRLSYVLASPVTLPAGEYWFSHDASIRSQPAVSSTAAPLTLETLTSSIKRTITPDELSRWIASQGEMSKDSVRFSFFGREMVVESSWKLGEAVVVRPNAVTEH